MKRNKAQVSIEYLIIVGFVTFVVMAIIGIALFYSGTIKDKIKENQVGNYANKIIATAESVYYAGEPSKATISGYLPESVKDIRIEENSLVITFSTSSGKNIIAYSSDVPIIESSTAELSPSKGLKKIVVVAEENQVVISQA